MKKSSILFVLCMALLGALFTSCERGTESLLKGTWKKVDTDYSQVSNEMTLYLNGSGSFTWTIVDSEKRVVKGEYKVIGRSIFFSYPDMNGVGGSMGGVFDLESNPPIMYEMTMLDPNGNFYQNIKFEKQ